MRLLLASKSPARRRLLESAGIPFELRDSTADEVAEKSRLRSVGADARGLAAGLAERKALGVRDADAGDLVLGADQTLERNDGSMLDKPVSRADALDQLRSLSGRPHRLHAAAAIAQDGAIVWQATESVVLHVRDLSDAFLAAYLDREYDAVRNNVGCYRIEGPGVQLFSGIEGSHSAILGLPLFPLCDYLRRRGLLEG